MSNMGVADLSSYTTRFRDVAATAFQVSRFSSLSGSTTIVGHCQNHFNLSSHTFQQLSPYSLLFIITFFRNSVICVGIISELAVLSPTIATANIREIALHHFPFLWFRLPFIHAFLLSSFFASFLPLAHTADEGGNGARRSRRETRF